MIKSALEEETANQMKKTNNEWIMLIEQMGLDSYEELLKDLTEQLIIEVAEEEQNQGLIEEAAASDLIISPLLKTLTLEVLNCDSLQNEILMANLKIHEKGMPMSIPEVEESQEIGMSMMEELAMVGEENSISCIKLDDLQKMETHPSPGKMH